MRDIPAPFQKWPGHIGNWYRWADDRGALNLVTPEAVLRGVSSVISGNVVTCSRPMSERDEIIPETVFRHEMICAGRVPHWPEREVQNASDKIAGWVHGTANTHVDALAHIGFLGYGFNGHRHEDMVSMEQGVKRCDATAVLGVVTRGILVDVPRKRGIAALEPGDYVTTADIEAEAALVEPGDAFLVRLGPSQGRGDQGSGDVHGTWAGLHADCIELLGSRGIALVGTDGPGDCYPSPLKGTCDSPVHVLCAVFWGIHLIHNMDLDALSMRCAEAGRNRFLFSITALNVPRSTGSLTTPVAVL